MTHDIIMRYLPVSLFGIALGMAGIRLDNPYGWILLALFVWNGIPYKKSTQ